MASSPCCMRAIPLSTTSTKVATSDKEHLPPTLSHDTPTSLNSWTCVRTTASKKSALEIFSTPYYGSPISSRSVPYSTLMRPWDQVYGDKFEVFYTKYEREGRACKTMKTHKLFAIMKAQIETAGPSMLYKDAANCKSNQKNFGTTKSSNLCTGIIEYSPPDKVALCKPCLQCPSRLHQSW
jgi:hypothetical protein